MAHRTAHATGQDLQYSAHTQHCIPHTIQHTAAYGAQHDSRPHAARHGMVQHTAHNMHHGAPPNCRGDGPASSLAHVHMAKSGESSHTAWWTACHTRPRTVPHTDSTKEPHTARHMTQPPQTAPCTVQHCTQHTAPHTTHSNRLCTQHAALANREPRSTANGQQPTASNGMVHSIQH